LKIVYIQIMHWFEIGVLVVLLTVANGAPVIARNLLGDHASQPIDFGILWYDRKPLLGRSKTFRGLVCSLLATAIAAVILGWDWKIGLLAAAFAMAGDLLSSFLKRRFGLPSSARATGLDQIPESTVPTVLLASKLGLSWPDVVVTTCVFLVGAIILSKVLYRLRIRRRPY
jgi:CDP-diglyceride synthetase